MRTIHNKPHDLDSRQVEADRQRGKCNSNVSVPYPSQICGHSSRSDACQIVQRAAREPPAAMPCCNSNSKAPKKSRIPLSALAQRTRFDPTRCGLQPEHDSHSNQGGNPCGPRLCQYDDNHNKYNKQSITCPLPTRLGQLGGGDG